jgi:hypothetical protein
MSILPFRPSFGGGAVPPLLALLIMTEQVPKGQQRPCYLRGQERLAHRAAVALVAAKLGLLPPVGVLSE